MFSLFKRNKSKVEVPEWASFFDEVEYTKFLKSIESYFYSKNVTYTLGDGLIDVSSNDFGFGTMGLVNVAQVCMQDSITNYQHIVDEHFEALIRTNLFEKEFNKIIADYEKVKEYIGVRLYPNDYFEQIGMGNLIGKDFALDVFATLVFDLPDGINSIRPDQADNWGKTLDELFETGLQNITKKYSFDISLESFADFNIWFVQSDGFFTPNILFDLRSHPELIGSNGSIVGIPHRHVVIIYPIENLEIVKVISALIPVIKGMYNEGPGSVSEKLFWYKEEKFENLPYQIEEGKIQFSPTEDFLNMLNTLQ